MRQRTFLSTLAETLGSGMALSLSPTSAPGQPSSGASGRTLDHVLDQDRLVGGGLVDLELLVVRAARASASSAARAHGRDEEDLLGRGAGRAASGVRHC